MKTTKSLQFILILLCSMALFMAANAVTKLVYGLPPARVDYSNSNNLYFDAYCNFGTSIDKMDTDDLRIKYLKATNDYFNLNIKKMMSTEQKISLKDMEEARDMPESIEGVAPSFNPDNFTNIQKDMIRNLCYSKDDYQCTMFVLCNNNYSTYCVAQNALGFSPKNAGRMDKLVADQNFKYLKTSYFCYRSGLQLKDGDVQEKTGKTQMIKCQGKTEEDSDKKNDICQYFDLLLPKAQQRFGAAFSNCMQDPTPACFNPQLATYKGIANPLNAKDTDDYNSNLWKMSKGLEKNGMSSSAFDVLDSLTSQSKDITDEIARAKDVLDVTLATYNELKMSWRMHVRYVKIFLDLVKYRDYLVDVRRQTDVFPAKFVDATTARCL